MSGWGNALHLTHKLDGLESSNFAYGLWVDYHNNLSMASFAAEILHIQ